MPKLSTLLWVDDQFHDHDAIAIDPSFGDKYLITMNPLFARIRRLTIDCGGQYSAEPTPAWRDYQNASLFCLGQILATGAIPYVTNGETLKRIVLTAPTGDVSANSLPRLLRKNVLLHESAHLCSDRILAKSLPPTGEKSDFVLRCLIAESFANTVELITGVLIDSDMHRLFFIMNSYLSMTSPRAGLIRTCLLTAGIRNVMCLGLITYLYLNSHNCSVPEDFADKAIEITIREPATVSSKQLSMLRELVNTSFTLNNIFRTETTPLFFSLYHSVREYRAFAESFSEPFALKDRVISMIHVLVDSVFPATDYQLTKTLSELSTNERAS